MVHPKTAPVIQKQSAFSLSAIQITGAISLPVLNASIHLSHEFGFVASLWILLFSSLLIWLLSYAIISMTANTTKNTLENTHDYLGHMGTYLVAFTLLTATIASFVLQTNDATLVVLRMLPITSAYHVNTFIQIGVGFGVISTLASMEGMKSLRWVALIFFPLLLTAFLIFLLFIPRNLSPVSITSNFSLYSLVIALAVSLSVAVDYPTFFRHSLSKRSSLLAISLIQIISFLIGIGGLYLGKYIDLKTHISGWHAVFSTQLFLQILFLILIIISCLCVNMVNIYSASIAWEVVVPILAGRKEYTILGLGLTSAFVLITYLIPMHLMLKITEIILSNLCLVLVIGYLGKLWNRGVIAQSDKVIYCLAWVTGSSIALYGTLQEQATLLLTGFSLSVVAVVITFTNRKLFHSALRFYK